MSDFLERLATRAVGSETALAPRLPSLFEPLQRALIMPVSDDGEASPRHREAVSVATAAPTVAPRRSPQAPVAPPPAAARGGPAAVDPVAPQMPAQIAASTPRMVVQPAPISAPVRSSVGARSVAPPAPAPPAEAVGSPPVRPQQTRIAREQAQTAVPLPPSNGSLLPAATPVFGAAAGPARSIHAAAMRARVAQPGSGEAGGEPVVHVSIGRLEVRASPAPGTPARRRDSPSPSSLDDYLRQRGGKVSP